MSEPTPPEPTAALVAAMHQVVRYAIDGPDAQPVLTTKNKPAVRLQARRNKQKAARAARKRNRRAK